MPATSESARATGVARSDSAVVATAASAATKLLIYPLPPHPHPSMPVRQPDEEEDSGMRVRFRCADLLGLDDEGFGRQPEGHQQLGPLVGAARWHLYTPKPVPSARRSHATCRPSMRGSSQSPEALSPSGSSSFRRRWREHAGDVDGDRSIDVRQRRIVPLRPLFEHAFDTARSECACRRRAFFDGSRCAPEAIQRANVRSYAAAASLPDAWRPPPVVSCEALPASAFDPPFCEVPSSRRWRPPDSDVPESAPLVAAVDARAVAFCGGVAACRP